jgi:hypothetical protein
VTAPAGQRDNLIKIEEKVDDKSVYEKEELLFAYGFQ